MTWIVKKSTKRQQLTFIGMLTRALRIEADDDDYVDAVETIAVEKRYFAIGGAALNSPRGAPSSSGRLHGKYIKMFRPIIAGASSYPIQCARAAASNRRS
jgi:hypothetical protein